MSKIITLDKFIEKSYGKKGSKKREKFEKGLEEFKLQELEKQNKWVQGYVAAIAIILKLEGIGTTTIFEAYKAGLGNSSIDDLITMGCDEDDIEIIKNMLF